MELVLVAVTAFVAAHPALSQLNQWQQQAYIAVTSAVLVFYITLGGTVSFEQGVLNMDWWVVHAVCRMTDLLARSVRIPSPGLRLTCHHTPRSKTGCTRTPWRRAPTTSASARR